MNWTGPFEIVNAAGRAPLVIACDHASNAVPPEIGDLGVSDADMQRHIAWDIGAAAISRHLAKAFDAPAILCGTSRLVIDCNRQLRDPTLIPAISDGTPVPTNERLSLEQRAQRISAYFDSYHNACREILDARCGSGRRPLFLAVHSMTDRMKGKFRPWDIALSSNENRRATDPALVVLRQTDGIVVGDNEPYDMNVDEDYSTPEHALSRGLHYLQVEFRQDMVATPQGQRRFAEIFAPAVTAAIASCHCS
ncbi:MAG: N-formylglutamate amidohydrolase [Hyphomicrobiales bacterium]